MNKSDSFYFIFMLPSSPECLLWKETTTDNLFISNHKMRHIISQVHMIQHMMYFKKTILIRYLERRTHYEPIVRLYYNLKLATVRKGKNDFCEPMRILNHPSEAQLLLSESNEPTPLYPLLLTALSLNTQSEL